ncbi:hypothetical protein H671_2g7615 [Cricetulus griseus]|nr:hypothetical protein H671_2g7615 [Cricetulus griseus]
MLLRRMADDPDLPVSTWTTDVHHVHFYAVLGSSLGLLVSEALLDNEERAGLQTQIMQKPQVQLDTAV